jgi:hypothetical protein
MTPEELATTLDKFCAHYPEIDTDDIAAAATLIRELAARQIKVRWLGNFAHVGSLHVGQMFHNSSRKVQWVVSVTEGEADTIAEARAAVEAATIKLLTELS